MPKDKQPASKRPKPDPNKRIDELISALDELHNAFGWPPLSFYLKERKGA